MKLTLKGITKQYGNQPVLKSISFDLSEGVYGLLGANGAGKTTLLNIISQAVAPSSGEINLDDSQVTQEEYYKNLGFLPQNFSYYPDFTGLEFLMYMGALKGIDKKNITKICQDLLELVGLFDVKDKKIAFYSGGMKQRLGIAQALINAPQLLVLDEPTVGLDPQERVRFRNLISTLSTNKIVILSTHIVSDIEYIANEILILKEGEIKERGDAKKLLSLVKDKIWEITVDNEKARNMLSQYVIINQKSSEKGTILRLISEKEPDKQARQVEPVLEDLYLYYFGKDLANERVI